MKILVIDDDRQIVKTTCDILKVKGYETVTAYSGEEGVEKVAGGAPDCVLMDIKMPGITGVEAMKRMEAIAPDLPVVLVSAYATDDLLDEAKRAGALAVLGKPLDFTLILHFLELLHKQESILVVDDDPGFCKSLKDILTLKGFNVEAELDSYHVLDHLKNGYKLAVLLDIKLGSENGIDVLRTVLEKYPTKPVILMTGHREELLHSIKNGQRIGAYACLYKPYEMEDLFKLIEKIRIEKLQNLLAG